MPQYLIILALLLFGLINCFFGYRAFKALLPFWGLAIGGFLGLTGAGELFPENAVAAVAGATLGGLLGGALFAFVYFLGVFVVGAGFAVTLAATAMTTEQVEFQAPALALAGLVGGAGALLAQKLTIVLATAFAGSAAMLTGFFAMLEHRPMTHYFIDPEVLGQFFLPALVATFVFGMIGAVVQFMVTASMGKS